MMAARRKLTFLDLFAGGGGLTRGFADAGFAPAGAVDNDLASAATLSANFPRCDVRWAPVRTYRTVPAVDVVVGGPPCQGFSTLGKRDPGDVRNRLWREYARVVAASGCKAFVLENVDRFGQSPEFASLVAATRARGSLAGFQIEAYQLNAADFGVPQRRVRTVIVGSRVGPIGAPLRSHSRDEAQGLLPWRTLWDSIEELPYTPETNALPDARDVFFGQSVPGPFKLSEIHIGRTYMPRSLQRFRRIPPGGNRFNLPDSLKAPCWLRHTSGSGDVMGRLEWNKPAVTIRTEFFKPEKGRYLHPHMHRALSHAEAAVIQGFDDRHVWCGSKIEIARQIGNAVPPPLAEAVAKRIREALTA